MTAKAPEAAKKPAVITHPLKFPIVYTPEGADAPITVSELILRRPKARDMKAQDDVQRAGGSELDATFAMLASINGLPVEAVLELDAEDMTDVSEIIIGFLPKRLLQQIGAAS